jgi:hypothetical protein
VRCTYVHCSSQCSIFSQLGETFVLLQGSNTLQLESKPKAEPSAERPAARHVVIWHVPPPEIESAQGLLGVRRQSASIVKQDYI